MIAPLIAISILSNQLAILAASANYKKPMNRTPVKSSQIASIGHDPATNKLHVEFIGRNGVSGKVYEYDNVTAADHTALISAPSVYSHFHANIKGKNPFRAL